MNFSEGHIFYAKFFIWSARAATAREFSVAAAVMKFSALFEAIPRYISNFLPKFWIALYKCLKYLRISLPEMCQLNYGGLLFWQRVRVPLGKIVVMFFYSKNIFRQLWNCRLFFFTDIMRIGSNIQNGNAHRFQKDFLRENWTNW